MISTETPENSAVNLPDIQIGRSVGAKARNYDIMLPDGGTVNLTEGTRITNVEIIAGKGRNRRIDEIGALIEEFGGNADNWQKVKGIGHVDYDGESYRTELHWYQEPSIGRVKMKLKPQLGGNWYIED